MQRKSKQVGYALIELMVVSLVIAVLVVLGVPQYNRFIAKSRQSEAKNHLSHIYTLQETYQAEYETYKNFGNIGNGDPISCPGDDDNELGFRPPACAELRYTYSVSGSDNTSFTAKALSRGGSLDAAIYPSCALPDQWFTSDKRDLRVGNGPPGHDPPGVMGNNVLIDCEP